MRLDLRERETLLRIAPHLVEPLEFLIPFLTGAPGVAAAAAARTHALRRVELRPQPAGAPHADLLKGRVRLRTAMHFRARSCAEGPGTTMRASTFPERLALENVLEAEAHGANGRSTTAKWCPRP